MQLYPSDHVALPEALVAYFHNMLVLLLGHLNGLKLLLLVVMQIRHPIPHLFRPLLLFLPQFVQSLFILYERCTAVDGWHGCTKFLRLAE